MRIVITGATGFIGGYLVPFLAPRHEVFCLARDPSRLPQIPSVTPVRGDLGAPDALANLPEKADAIVHLAQANVPFPERANELFDVNALSTQRLADYARRAGVANFVYASSGSVYAPTDQVMTEDSLVRPQGFYPLTKQLSEAVLACYQPQLNVCILRLFAPYGPGQTARMIPGIIGRVRSGQVVTLANGGQPRVNPIYIDDVLRVIDQALSLKGHHTVNAAGPEVVSIADIAAIAGKALGAEPRLEHRTDPTRINLVADTARMLATFPLPNMVTAREGIRRTAEAMMGATR
ncbi:MAG: NAD(P)-dependent oxidoreductase [Chloroflexi bacterium]|nr:NAD(P)-dependent oxidoreductase [Chloroflexota bacterium]